MANTKVPVELSSTPGIVDNSNATAITIDSSENAAFTGTVTANAGVVVDNITIDGTEIDLSSGDLDIDVAGNIRLDADDAGEIRFLDGGTQYAAIKKDSNDAVVQSIVADGDLVLKGIDGSSVISALTLDMSDAGAAIFNNSIRIGQSTAANLFVGKNGDVVEIKAAKDGTDDIDLSFHTQATGGTVGEAMRLTSGGSAKFYQNALLETAGKYFQVAGSSSTFWAIGSSGGSNPPGTASTSLAFHHFDGSAWNNEIEFDSSGNITLDGSIVFSNNSKLRQDSAGLIMETLDSNEDLLFIGNDGGSTITAVRIDMSEAGAIICNGNITAFGNTSDIKLKENIEVIPHALDKVKQLKGVTFNYKKDGKVSTGLIAQDLEKVLPEAVYESSDIDNDEDKHLAIRYGNTVGLLVEAIKELEAKVKELEGK